MNSVRTPYQAFPPAAPLPPAEPTTRERIDRFKTLARRALGYWKIAMLILVVGCAASVAVAMKVKLIYRSECTILFKPSIKTSDRPDEESPGDRSQRMGAKLKDVLTTRTRLEMLIKQFDLYPKTVESKGMVEAVDEMQGHIGFRSRDSETFVISFENETPELAQQVSQKLADSMIAEFTRSSLSTTKQEADFLAKQEQRAADELENANKALATFLTVHPEFAVEAKTAAFGPAGGVVQPAVPFMPNVPKEPQAMGDPQLSVLLRQRARLEAELRNNSAGGAAQVAPAPTGGAASQDLVNKLTVQRDEAAKNAAAAASDLADKRTRLTDEHPDVISAKLAADSAARQLHQSEVQLASAQAALSGHATQANPYDAPAADSSVQAKIAQLNAAIAARQGTVKHAQPPQPAAEAGGAPVAAVAETNELVQIETEWQHLLRVLHDVRLEHEDLKQRLERARLSASAAEASGGDQMSVLDPAYKPLRPSKGGRTKTAMMGGLGTLLLALAYAFSRVLFNDTIIDSADVEALRVIPVLGVLPKVRAMPPPGTAGGPSPPAPASPKGGPGV